MLTKGIILSKLYKHENTMITKVSFNWHLRNNSGTNYLCFINSKRGLFLNTFNITCLRLHCGLQIHINDCFQREWSVECICLSIWKTKPKELSFTGLFVETDFVYIILCFISSTFFDSNTCLCCTEEYLFVCLYTKNIP